LFIGAMVGGSVGTWAHRLFPVYTANPGAYALVGMGAAFAGIVRAPMTSVLMIFEMTQDYAVIVPLMISNLVSLFISSRLQRMPIYEALAIQDGVHLPSAESRHVDGQRRAAWIMRPPTEFLAARLTVAEAVEQTRGSKFHSWLVVSESGVVGVINRLTLEQEVAQNPGKQVGDIVDRLMFPHVHSDQGINVALERMGANHLDILPVVNRANIHQLEGTVTLRDVLNSYGINSEA
jgi:CIC family chloride channel protein